eukprot:6598747-Prymnesium_polylepis.1
MGRISQCSAVYAIRAYGHARTPVPQPSLRPSVKVPSQLEARDGTVFPAGNESTTDCKRRSASHGGSWWMSHAWKRGGWTARLQGHPAEQELGEMATDAILQACLPRAHQDHHQAESDDVRNGGPVVPTEQRHYKEGRRQVPGVRSHIRQQSNASRVEPVVPLLLFGQPHIPHPASPLPWPQNWAQALQPSLPPPASVPAELSAQILAC